MHMKYPSLMPHVRMVAVFSCEMVSKRGKTFDFMYIDEPQLMTVYNLFVALLFFKRLSRIHFDVKTSMHAESTNFIVTIHLIFPNITVFICVFNSK